MLDFQLDGIGTVRAALDQQRAAINDSIVSIMQGLATWPEPGPEPPRDIYGIWAHVWRQELAEAANRLGVVANTLAGLLTALQGIDNDAAAALLGG